MALFDLPVEKLRTYRPVLAEPEHLDDFWAQTLAEARACPIAAEFAPIEGVLSVIDTFDVTYAGFGGQPIKAWLHLPAGTARPLPAVVEYVGYGGGRGLAHERTLFAQAGYAHLVMDTRGQGSTSSVGETPDPVSAGSAGPAHPGFMTRGVLDPHTYYYRRVFVDAVRAVEAAQAHPAVDSSRVAVTGASQGGGISIAVAGVSGDVIAAMPDVPFLSDFARATTLTDRDPYGEIARYLRVHRDQAARVYQTLAYFDVAILARRARAPALFSVGLMDETCPPSTVYAAFNHYGGPKEMVEYPFNGHEGGEAFQDVAKLHWLAAQLAVGSRL